MAGQGEGADREVVMLGSDATGLDRYMIFVDARDVQDVDDLPTRGEQNWLSIGGWFPFKRKF